MKILKTDNVLATVLHCILGRSVQSCPTLELPLYTTEISKLCILPVKHIYMHTMYSAYVQDMYIF